MRNIIKKIWQDTLSDYRKDSDMFFAVVFILLAAGYGLFMTVGGFTWVW